MAGILAAVMMITSVPETVYAAGQAGRMEQENAASVEYGINADEKFDGGDDIKETVSDAADGMQAGISDESSGTVENDCGQQQSEETSDVRDDADGVAGTNEAEQPPAEDADSADDTETEQPPAEDAEGADTVEAEQPPAEDADGADTAEAEQPPATNPDDGEEPLPELDEAAQDDADVSAVGEVWDESGTAAAYGDVSVYASSGNGIVDKLNELRNVYPGGKYWWRVNGVNTVTSTPCNHNFNTSSPYYYAKRCGYYNGGYQCWAFASKVFCDVFGQNPNIGGGKRYDRENIKVGDYVRYSNKDEGHSFIVIGRDGNTLKIADCNGTSTLCMIRWDGSVNLYDAYPGTSYTFAYYCRATNYDEIANIQPPRIKGSYMNTGYEQTIPDGYYHIASSLGDQWWLTIAGFSMENGGNVDLYDYSGMGFECDDHLFYFKFIDEGGGRGFYKITNKLSGKCLDVADGSEYMYDVNGNPTNVQQYEDNGSSAQQWAVRQVDGGGKGVLYTFQARCSGFCLDLCGGDASLKNSANISMFEDNGTLAQQWRLVPYAPAVGQTIEDGEYQIVYHAAENKAAGAADHTNGANIELSSSYKGDYRQIFDVKYLGNGYYSIINKYSGLSLDVAGVSRALGTNAWLWEGVDNDAQKWIIKPCGNGCYSVISKCNALYLDLEGGDTKDGNNISMWHWNSGGTNQMWKFVSYVPKLDPPAASIPSGTEVEAGTAVSLLSGTDSAAIYYTLDGTEPSEESYHYSRPFIIEKDTVITAYVVKDGYEDSDPAVFTYTVKAQDDYGKGDVLEEDIPQGKVENIPQGLWMSAVSSQVYTGRAIKPQVRVYDHTTLLTEKKDYTISYKNNVKANIASGVNVPTITVTGKGNYTGKEVQTFVIRPKNLSDADIMADGITLQYNGKVQKPLPVVTWNGGKLTRNKDYTVSYPDEESDGVADPTAYIKAGTYTVLVKGMGNYTGGKTIELAITQSKSASTMTVAKIADRTYTGTAVMPVPVVKSGRVVLTEGEDYEVSYQNNIHVGMATVMITGKGSYAGVKKAAFKIVPRAFLNKARAELEFDSPLVYTGRAVRPDRCRLTVSEKNADGRTSAVTLTEGTDYEASYRNDDKAGTATVIFQGINGYSGTLKKTYRIAPYDIGKEETDLTETEHRLRIELADSYAYAKGGCKPEPVVTFQGKILIKGTDYTLSYRNNNSLNDGSSPNKQPVVIVRGKGCFMGAREKTYRITSKEIGGLTMTAADRVWQNKGNIYKTKVAIEDENGKKLIAGKDYDSAFTYEYDSDTILSDGTLRYARERIMAQDIIPAGTVIRVTAAAKGSNYAGTASCVYRIAKADIGRASVTIPAQTYTGRAVTVENEIRIKLNGKTLSEDNYRIAGYRNNVNKGTASVTISGINDCGGKKTVNFKIRGKGFLWWWR